MQKLIDDLCNLIDVTGTKIRLGHQPVILQNYTHDHSHICYSCHYGRAVISLDCLIQRLKNGQAVLQEG